MFIILSQVVVALLLAISLWCELSHKYRDCNLHVTIRWILMMVCIIFGFGLQVFATSHVLVQACVFVVTLVVARLVHKKVLMKQIKVRNYRLLKKYLGGLGVKSFNRK